MSWIVWNDPLTAKSILNELRYLLGHRVESAFLDDPMVTLSKNDELFVHSEYLDHLLHLIRERLHDDPWKTIERAYKRTK